MLDSDVGVDEEKILSNIAALKVEKQKLKLKIAYRKSIENNDEIQRLQAALDKKASRFVLFITLILGVAGLVLSFSVFDIENRIDKISDSVLELQNAAAVANLPAIVVPSALSRQSTDCIIFCVMVALCALACETAYRLGWKVLSQRHVDPYNKPIDAHNEITVAVKQDAPAGVKQACVKLANGSPVIENAINS